MSAADEIIAAHSQEVRDLCERVGLRRLEIFGSSTTENFDPMRSDLDFLYEFLDYTDANLSKHFFGLLEGLQEIFKRPVDIVDTTAIRNPFFLRKVNTQRRLLYAA